MVMCHTQGLRNLMTAVSTLSEPFPGLLHTGVAILFTCSLLKSDEPGPTTLSVMPCTPPGNLNRASTSSQSTLFKPSNQAWWSVRPRNNTLPVLSPMSFLDRQGAYRDLDECKPKRIVKRERHQANFSIRGKAIMIGTMNRAEVAPEIQPLNTRLVGSQHNGKPRPFCKCMYVPRCKSGR